MSVTGQRGRPTAAAGSAHGGARRRSRGERGQGSMEEPDENDFDLLSGFPGGGGGVLALSLSFSYTHSHYPIKTPGLPPCAGGCPHGTHLMGAPSSWEHLPEGSTRRAGAQRSPNSTQKLRAPSALLPRASPRLLPGPRCGWIPGCGGRKKPRQQAALRGPDGTPP